jgi:hypothetical protein
MELLATLMMTNQQSATISEEGFQEGSNNNKLTTMPTTPVEFLL